MKAKKIPKAINNLKLLQDIFKRNNKICWLQDGTLLGFIREGNIIAHDSDTDVGMKFEDLSVNLVNDILSEKFSIKHIMGYRNDSLIIQLQKDLVKIDIFIYYDLDNTHFYHSAFDKNLQRIDYVYKKFNTVTKEFFNYDFIIPEDPMYFIVTKYGNTWNIPNANWDYAYSPLNHKKTDIVLDVNKCSEEFNNWTKMEKI